MARLSRLPYYFKESGFRDPHRRFRWPIPVCHRNQAPLLRLASITLNSSKVLQYRDGHYWYEYYPVEENLSAAGSEPLLVDIGGGLGHDLMAFQQKLHHQPGKLVLQDLPVVIGDVKGLPSGVEAMKHGFCEPQPVRNAQAYYLRMVLHERPDKQAREILSNILGSKLLTNENVLPEQMYPFILLSSIY